LTSARGSHGGETSRKLKTYGPVGPRRKASLTRHSGVPRFGRSFPGGDGWPLLSIGDVEGELAQVCNISF
jgi:hypothetical protein